jgi:hypothetical protein
MYIFSPLVYPYFPRRKMATDPPSVTDGKRPDRKRRRPITNDHRRLIRKRYHDSSQEKLTYDGLSKWFLKEHDHYISISSIDEILSPTFAYFNDSNERASAQ